MDEPCRFQVLQDSKHELAEKVFLIKVDYPKQPKLMNYTVKQDSINK